jgi:hypothetical protein
MKKNSFLRSNAVYIDLAAVVFIVTYVIFFTSLGKEITSPSENIIHNSDTVEVALDTVYRFDEHKFVYSEKTLTIDSAYVGGNVFVSNGKKLIKE